MMNANTCDRADLELAILENEILPCDAAGLERITAMTTDQLRDAVVAWIEDGDECAGS